MSTRLLPTSTEPVTDEGGIMTHNWYRAFRSIVQYVPGDINETTPATDTYFMDWAQADETRVTLTRNLTITQQGALDGQRLSVSLIQGGSGGYTVTFTSETDFGAAGAPVLSTAAGLRDRLEFIYNSAINKYDMISFAKGFSG